ncbi:MAG: HDOD domain-containing protein [Pseudomonadota bacterium]
MQEQQIKGLNGWVEFLSSAEIPVLKQSARDIAALRKDAEHLGARAMAAVVLRDPMLTAKLLRYLQQHKHRSQEHEVVEVEQALLMLGVETIFNRLPLQPVMDEVLHGHLDALICALRVVHRSNRAATYAYDWAVRQRDMHFEEVHVATLLHDLAELLMWCFAPATMLHIHALQLHDKTLRSHDVQEQVLGFPLSELQSALAVKWGLPRLLLTLMDDACAQQPRVRTVTLAVNLARHSAVDWNDAALPDDYKNIAELLNMSAEDAAAMVVPKEMAQSSAGD